MSSLGCGSSSSSNSIRLLLLLLGGGGGGGSARSDAGGGRWNATMRSGHFRSDRNGLDTPTTKRVDVVALLLLAALLVDAAVGAVGRFVVAAVNGSPFAGLVVVVASVPANVPCLFDWATKTYRCQNTYMPAPPPPLPLAPAPTRLTSTRDVSCGFCRGDEECRPQPNCGDGCGFNLDTYS